MTKCRLIEHPSHLARPLWHHASHPRRLSSHLRCPFPHPRCAFSCPRRCSGPTHAFLPLIHVSRASHMRPWSSGPTMHSSHASRPPPSIPASSQRPGLLPASRPPPSVPASSQRPGLLPCVSPTPTRPGPQRHHPTPDTRPHPHPHFPLPAMRSCPRPTHGTRHPRSMCCQPR